VTASLGVPVVPAHIEGAHRILAKGKFMPRPGPVTVRFGEPITFKSNQFDPRLGRGPRRAAVELLEQRIRALSGRPSAGDVIGLPEELVEEEQATISASAILQGDRNTRNQRRSRVLE
jgi:1-acyl-sn-glycerol-3-phosphate acyltransferase